MIAAIKSELVERKWLNEEDFVEHLINATSHDYILMFTNKGKVYRIKGYEIPEYSRQAKGLLIINLL
mgnify:CR=1 FL=1